MKVCDFARSFLTFRIDVQKKPQTTVSHKPPFTLNNARIQLECRCQLSNAKSGVFAEYVLGASCKTERVNVTEDIWTQPNADFSPVMSREDFLLIKSWDKCDKGVMLYPPSLGAQPERQVGKIADAWDSLRIDVRMTEGKILGTTEQIVQATLENRPLISRTEFDAPNGQHILLEYPVKTMNASERDGFYQIDTGPVLFPDFADGCRNPMESFRLAFIAHNCPDWAEFIVNVPMPVADGVSVNHYSQVRRVNCRNSVIEMSSAVDNS